MPKAVINNIEIHFETGTSILSASQKLGIEIPTMCYIHGFEPYTSCMVCMVEDTKTGRVVPSCSTVLQDGMHIATDSKTAINSRRDALELLLSDHLGDCEAPCRVVCPSYMDIPEMNRLIAAGKFKEALVRVKNDIALPEVLGYICPAPCENICRRKPIDEAVSICTLKRYVAHTDLVSDNTFLPTKMPHTGKRVAIIGSGPTGLAAAYYLLGMGHACTIFEKEAQLGGMLRYGALKHNLPSEVLDREIAVIEQLGLEIETQIDVNKQKFAEIRQKYDAVVFAVGEMPIQKFEELGFTTTKTGIDYNTDTYTTNLEAVFTGGNSVRKQRMAVRATGHGKEIAYSIDQFLKGEKVQGYTKRFNSKFGKLNMYEVTEYLKESNQSQRTLPSKGMEFGFTEEEAIAEAKRCMHCDCRKADNCKLRDYSELYDANQKKYWASERKNITKDVRHDFVVYEPQKCIKCSLCIKITDKEELNGLTFIGRGFDVHIDAALQKTMSEALSTTAQKCIDACPTGALSNK